MRRVVITGMGIWSCLGQNLDEVRASLFEGKSGIGIDPARKEYGYRSLLTGIVPAPVLKGVLDRRLRAGMSEEAEYAYMASREAFANAGVDDDYLLANVVGVIFGNDSSAKPVIETNRIMEQYKDSAMLGSGLIFQSMNSTVNMNMSTVFHLRGVNFTLSADGIRCSYSCSRSSSWIGKSGQIQAWRCPCTPPLYGWSQ